MLSLLRELSCNDQGRRSERTTLPDQLWARSVGVRILIFLLLCFALFPVRMSGHRGSGRRTPFVLAGTGGAADGLVDQLEGATDDIEGSFAGLTIVSAPDDEGSGWMGVEPHVRPQSAPVRGMRSTTRSFSGALSVASSMTDPPTIRSAVPASRSGSSRGGGG